MLEIKITGKSHFQNIGTGFWGIIGNDNKKWRPINMPEQLKQEGKIVNIKARIEDNDFSIEMWGTAIRIINFET